jgi:hypothetical protein
VKPWAKEYQPFGLKSFCETDVVVSSFGSPKDWYSLAHGETVGKLHDGAVYQLGG